MPKKKSTNRLIHMQPDLYKYTEITNYNIKDFKLYQLSARGQLACFNQKTVIKSKFIFTSEEKAKKYMEEFLEICTTPKDDSDLTYIDDKDYEVEISVIELVVKE